MNHETNFHKNSGPMWEQMALSAVITRRRIFATVFAITFVFIGIGDHSFTQAVRIPNEASSQEWAPGCGR